MLFLFVVGQIYGRLDEDLSRCFVVVNRRVIMNDKLCFFCIKKCNTSVELRVIM